MKFKSDFKKIKESKKALTPAEKKTEIIEKLERTVKQMDIASEYGVLLNYW